MRVFVLFVLVFVFVCARARVTRLAAVTHGTEAPAATCYAGRARGQSQTQTSRPRL